ncbi:formimidoylglutamate deiminase [soil metagenome]
MTEFWCESAWVNGAVANGVVIDSDERGVVTAVGQTKTCPPGATRLTGLTLPGFANTHSHAFHRALRGRIQRGGGSFWEWRDAMFELAAKLDPDSYLDLATAVFSEMALAGYTLVGEFHYLHHQSGGRPYGEQNAMGMALAEAANRAGIRLTLLDACYLQGGIEQALAPTQFRFADGDVARWAERVDGLQADEMVRIGAAIHSVRAVPRSALATIAEFAADRPLHMHLSEQSAENEQTIAAFGVTPTALAADEGIMTSNFTAVHAIHLTPADVTALADAGVTVCACPTTEADLGDGIGPFAELKELGIRIALGSDQHVYLDPFLEAQRLEMDQRLRSSRRTHFQPEELLTSLTTSGYRSLGWPEGGAIEVGSLCDLTTIGFDSVRTAGSRGAEVLLAAAAADVIDVVVGGRSIVAGGKHVSGDVGRQLSAVIESVWER